MWYNQRNMHVQYNNTIINILRITETHVLTCYRPRKGVERPGWFQIPIRSRMITLRGYWPLVFLFSGYLITKQLAILKILNNLRQGVSNIGG
jgi:hypothetical protein